LVLQLLHRDGLIGQNRAAPSEPGRKGYFSAFYVPQGIENKLIPRTIEIAATKQKAFGKSELFFNLGEIRLTVFCY